MPVKQRVARLERQLEQVDVDFETLVRRARQRQIELGRRLKGLDFPALRALADDTNQSLDLRRKAFQWMLGRGSGAERAYVVAGLHGIQQQKCDEAKDRLERAVSVREKQLAAVLLAANQRVLRMHQRYRAEGVEGPDSPP